MPAYLDYDALGAWTLGSTNMTPTTLRTIGADFISTIEGITPSYPLHGGSPWTAVDSEERVPGEALRLFFISATPSEPTEEGIYGAGVEHTSFFRVFANYKNLDETTAAEAIDSDGGQLWIVLQERVDPVLDGLIDVQHIGWEPVEEDPGAEWGAHVFRVQFLKTHQA